MTLLYAALLATVHLLASKFRFLSDVPRSRWLSMAGGIAVAYVFVHIFPELKHMQEVVQRHLPPGHPISFLDTHVYLIALFGLTVFYGLERLARSSREQNGLRMPRNLFWLHVSSFGLYNVLVGYLLVSGIRTTTGDFLFFFAMALHFLTNDYGLSFDYKELYINKGRWLLSLAVLVGWGIGRAFTLPEIWIAALFSFLAGGAIMNVLKEELPEERKSNFWAFSMGVAGYTAVLIAV